MMERTGKKVRTSVYRKRTGTDRYLDFRSAHSGGTKFGLVRCLGERARRVCDEPDVLRKEMQELCRVFVRNGFPRRSVVKLLNQERKPRQQEKDDRPSMLIPYVPGISEKVKRIAENLQYK